jgi:ubiquinone/menaquinone biosynthesis C-methylase UbiE
MHDSDRRWRDFYNRWARTYDWGLRVWSLLRGFSDAGERRKLVSRLQSKPGERVLEVSVGTGSNLPLVADGVGLAGRMVGLDISLGMLRQCQKKLRRRRLKAELIEGEAAHLPFADDVFDGVLHFGGINEFGDKKTAIDEMMRVAKSGARIVISDEGLAPDKRASLRDRLLLRLNPLYAHGPPMELMPPQAQDIHLAWFRGDACYLIDFAKPHS